MWVVAVSPRVARGGAIGPLPQMGAATAALSACRAGTGSGVIRWVFPVLNGNDRLVGQLATPRLQRMENVCFGKGTHFPSVALGLRNGGDASSVGRHHPCSPAEKRACTTAGPLGLDALKVDLG